VDGAKPLFESLKKWADLNALVEEAYPEGVYLECKTQTGVTLKQGTKAQLAETVSAMSNAGGGVILLGVSTTPVKAHNLDVVSGLEPIGNVANLAARVEIELSQLTEPPVVGARVRVIKKGNSGSGVVAIQIPAASGDPVRSALDGHFYFRGSDGDLRAPYEVIRRLFAASEVPDLSVRMHVGLSEKGENGEFTIPLSVSNGSSALARDVCMTVTVQNPENCLRIDVTGFQDISGVNPGTKMFSNQLEQPIYRGLNFIPGRLVVTMAGDKWPRRIIEVKVTLYADKMRARSYNIRASLKKDGLEVKSVQGPEYLY